MRAFWGNGVHSHRASFYGGISIDTTYRTCHQACLCQTDLCRQLAGNTLYLWFCTHWFVSPFPRILPGCRWPWALLERPTIPLKYSLSECELLRMWHCERFRKISMHSATGMRSRKRRGVLCECGGGGRAVEIYPPFPGENGDALWPVLVVFEAKGSPESQACSWEALDKDVGMFERHSSPGFILLQSRHGWGAHTFDVHFRQDSGTHYSFWFPLSENLWSQEASVSSLRNSNFTLDSIPFLKKKYWIKPCSGYYVVGEALAKDQRRPLSPCQDLN